MWDHEQVGDDDSGSCATLRLGADGDLGFAATVYDETEVGVAIGPTEFNVIASGIDALASRVVDIVEAFVTGGARIDVAKHRHTYSTTITVPANGPAVASTNWKRVFPGYPEGTQIIGPQP
jgi:hypothetical protein